MMGKYRYLEISKIYDKIIEKYSKGDSKMIKELTVAEISEVLGYEVKVVKESTKPYQFKAGDVVECAHYTGAARIRLIVQPTYKEDLIAIDMCGKPTSNSSRMNFAGCRYKKLGQLKAFLVK